MVSIVSLEHRLLLLARHGVAATLVLPFDRELASWPPERFVSEVLHRALGCRRLLLGFDSAFGKERRGTYEYLRERRGELDLEVRRSEPVLVQGERVSSTLVRRSLAAGDLERAALLLGRRFSFLGRVVPGDGRGSAIGVPTANLHLGEAALLERGVYCVDVLRHAEAVEDSVEPGGEPPRRLLPGVMNIGRRPTFSGAPAAAGEAFDPARDTVEVHILDFEGDLYGEVLEVFVVRKEREERRFDSAEALVRQIRADVAGCRAARGGG